MSANRKKNKLPIRPVNVGEVYNVMNLVNKLLDRLHFVTLMDLPKSNTPEVLKDSDIKTIKSIVDNHPDFNLEAPINMPRESIFLVCCENGSDIEGIKYLIEKGTEINRTNFAGYNAIMLTIRNENMERQDKLELIKLLIEKGCDVNWIDIYGETPLCIALSRGEEEITELLLDNGAVLLDLDERHLPILQQPE